MIGIRLKEADSGASRCRDINFFRKKHRCFKSLATLTYENDDDNNDKISDTYEEDDNIGDDAKQGSGI